MAKRQNPSHRPRHRGRPRGAEKDPSLLPPTVRHKVDLPADLAATVRELAQQDGRSFAAMLRRLIVAGVGVLKAE
jgi:hypothetical protein